jgi:RNA recognition motif-containing protein
LKRLFVGSLPPTTTEASLTELFSQFGTVRSVELVKDLFSGACKGFGFIEMEGHEARAAIAGLNATMVEDRSIIVKYEVAKNNKGRRR